MSSTESAAAATVLSTFAPKHSQALTNTFFHNIMFIINIRSVTMKRILTLNTLNLDKSKQNGGCGECQTSCQSACKTSCGVANQKCEKAAK